MSDRPNSLQRELEKNIEKKTGMTIEEIRDQPFCESKSYLNFKERQEKARAQGEILTFDPTYMHY